MKLKKKLKYFSKMWNSFPLNLIYLTSEGNSLVPKKEDSVYVYSLYKVDNPFYEELKTKSVCFRIFLFTVLGIKEPVGFLFIPTLPEEYILRYTTMALVATLPNASKKSIIESNRKVLFKNSGIELIRLTCGTEIITDLGYKMNIYLGKA